MSGRRRASRPGQGVLRECLNAPDVESVLTVGRTATGQRHAKLREIVHTDLTGYAAVECDQRATKLEMLPRACAK